MKRVVMKKKDEIPKAAMSDFEIQGIIDGLSKARKLSKKMVSVALLSFAVCIPIGIKLGQLDYSLLAGIVALSPFAFIFVFIMRWNRLTKKINKVMGESVTRGVIQEKFEVEKYSPNDYLGRAFVDRRKLVGGWDKISGGHYLSGKYKGRGVMFSDIWLEYKEFGVAGRYFTIFQGPWIVLEHSQALTTPVWVIPEKDKEKGKKTIGEVFTDAFKEKAVKFSGNKDSQAKQTNESIAFSLIGPNWSEVSWKITPDFLKLLEAFHKEIPGSKYITLYENKICLAIHYGHSVFGNYSREFENIKAVRQEFRASIKLITAILDELIKIDCFLEH